MDDFFITVQDKTDANFPSDSDYKKHPKK